MGCDGFACIADLVFGGGFKGGNTLDFLDAVGL